MADETRQGGGNRATWEIEFYETEMGKVPVFEWLQDLPAHEQALALNHIDLLRLAGLEARRPLVAPLENKMYELRWKGYGKQNRIAYFAFTGRKFILLHAVVKKTSAWSKKDLDIAMQRMKDYERRHKL